MKVVASYYTNVLEDPEANASVYKTKDIDATYSISLGDSYKTFIPGGDYGYVCGNNRGLLALKGTYNGTLTTRCKYFELNDLSGDGYVLSNSEGASGLKGVAKISKIDSEVRATVDLSESGTIYNTQEQAASAINTALISYTPQTVNCISQAYINDILNGTNNSGYNSTNARYNYVYKIPNTNIYVKQA